MLYFISSRDFHLINLFLPNICMLFSMLFPFISRPAKFIILFQKYKFF